MRTVLTLLMIWTTSLCFASIDYKTKKANIIPSGSVITYPDGHTHTVQEAIGAYNQIGMSNIGATKLELKLFKRTAHRLSNIITNQAWMLRAKENIIGDYRRKAIASTIRGVVKDTIFGGIIVFGLIELVKASKN